MSRKVRSALQRFLFALCVMQFATCSLQAQTKLRWKFQEGQKLEQVMVQNMQMAMKFGDMDIKTDMKQTIDGIWSIDKIDQQGMASIAQRFTRIQMKMDAPNGTGFEFDSDKDQELTGVGALMAPALKAMAKSEFELQMTPAGKIQNVEVSQATVDALQSLPGAKQLGGMFSKKGLVKMIEQGSYAFPDEVQKGTSWKTESETDLPQVGTMVAETTLVYAGPEEVAGKPLERIDISIAIRINKKEGATAVELKNQKASGKLYFDNQAGRLSHSEISQEMTMAIAIGGNNVDQKITQLISFRLTPASRSK